MMPARLAGRYVRLHSGAAVGQATGDVRNGVDGVMVLVSWPGNVRLWEHERDLVWLNKISDLGTQHHA